MALSGNAGSDGPMFHKLLLSPRFSADRLRTPQPARAPIVASQFAPPYPRYLQPLMPGRHNGNIPDTFGLSGRAVLMGCAISQERPKMISRASVAWSPRSWAHELHSRC